VSKIISIKSKKTFPDPSAGLVKTDLPCHGVERRKNTRKQPQNTGFQLDGKKKRIKNRRSLRTNWGNRQNRLSNFSPTAVKVSSERKPRDREKGTRADSEKKEPRGCGLVKAGLHQKRLKGLSQLALRGQRLQPQTKRHRISFSGTWRRRRLWVTIQKILRGFQKNDINGGLRTRGHISSKHVYKEAVEECLRLQTRQSISKGKNSRNAIASGRRGKEATARWRAAGKRTDRNSLNSSETRFKWERGAARRTIDTNSSQSTTLGVSITGLKLQRH